MLVPHNSQDCEAAATQHEQNWTASNAWLCRNFAKQPCVQTQVEISAPIHTSNVSVSPAKIFNAFADTCCCGSVGLCKHSATWYYWFLWRESCLPTFDHVCKYTNGDMIQIFSIKIPPFFVWECWFRWCTSPKNHRSPSEWFQMVREGLRSKLSSPNYTHAVTWQTNSRKYPGAQTLNSLIWTSSGKSGNTSSILRGQCLNMSITWHKHVLILVSFLQVMRLWHEKSPTALALYLFNHAFAATTVGWLAKIRTSRNNKRNFWIAHACLHLWTP